MCDPQEISGLGVYQILPVNFLNGGVHDRAASCRPICFHMTHHLFVNGFTEMPLVPTVLAENRAMIAYSFWQHRSGLATDAFQKRNSARSRGQLQKVKLFLRRIPHPLTWAIFHRTCLDMKQTTR